MNIPKEHLIEWLAHPVTKEVMRNLEKIRTQYQESILAGSTVSLHSTETTALATVQNIGIISGLNVVLNISVEEEEE